jgi:hypothetical protein
MRIKRYVLIHDQPGLSILRNCAARSNLWVRVAAYDGELTG